MIYLLLAIGSSALVSISMRLSESRVTRGSALLCVNYITCMLLSWAYTGFAAPIPQVPGLSQALFLGGINGILFLAGFVLFQWSMPRMGLVLSSTFMKLGLLVCMVVSVIFFRESPGNAQWLGFALAVAAIVLINYRPGGEKAGSKLALLLILLCGGLGDAMVKVFEELGDPALGDHFLMYTFGMALIACIGLTALRKQGWPGIWELLFGLGVGIPNFFSSKFLLGALTTLPGVIVYPVYSVATILVVTLTGVAVFRERLDKRQWAALGMILAALVMLNI